MMKAPGGRPQKSGSTSKFDAFRSKTNFGKVKIKDAANGPTLGWMIRFQTEEETDEQL